jgi:hypothetical protein
MAIDPQALTGAVAGLGAVGWLIYKGVMDRKKSREAGLADNPSRCADHEGRLRSLESGQADIKIAVARVETKLVGVIEDIQEIRRKINGKG